MSWLPLSENDKKKLCLTVTIKVKTILSVSWSEKADKRLSKKVTFLVKNVVRIELIRLKILGISLDFWSVQVENVGIECKVVAVKN